MLRPGLRLLVLFSLWAGLSSCAQSPDLSSSPQAPQKSKSHQKPIVESKERKNVSQPELIDESLQSKVASLTLEEKVGQLFVIGFSGKSMNKTTEKLLSTIKPGSVILFSRNVGNYQQLRQFTDQLQASSLKNSKLPLLVMIDQEGGVVTRIKVGTSLPSALALAQTRHPQFIRNYSATMGQLLNRLGINMNLAPVLDASDPQQASFIGSRSFGESPLEVAQLGTSFALGQWDSGVIPTAKHFPGHGGLKTDSHKETPYKTLELSELMEGDLKPFQEFAQLEMPSAVMLGHVSFPRIDSSGFPAAFSKPLNHDLLREHLGYRGLAITDDLEMAGAGKVGDMSERTVQAILAGNDMIMVAWSEKRQLKAYQSILDAVKSGKISEERINQSVARILTIKSKVAEKTLRYDSKEIEKTRLKLVALSKDVKRLSFQSSLKNHQSNRSFPALGDEMAVYSSDPLFYKHFKRSFSRPSRWITLSKKNVQQRIDFLNQKKMKTPFVFYVSGTGTARWVDRLSLDNKKMAIVINTNQPGAIQDSSDFLKVVHLNSSSPESGTWLAEYLNQASQIRLPAADEEQY